MVVGDGVSPSDTGRGYVLRRLVRRVLTTSWRSDPDRTLGDLPDGPLGSALEHFGVPATRGGSARYRGEEERRFRDLRRRGVRLLSRRVSGRSLSDEDHRDLHATTAAPRPGRRAARRLGLSVRGAVRD